MNTKPKFSELSRSKQIAVIGSAAVQLALLVAALRDLSRRSPNEVKGPKWLWAGISFINFFGPAAYFTVGRRKPAK